MYQMQFFAKFEWSIVSGSQNSVFSLPASVFYACVAWANEMKYYCFIDILKINQSPTFCLFRVSSNFIINWKGKKKYLGFNFQKFLGKYLLSYILKFQNSEQISLFDCYKTVKGVFVFLNVFFFACSIMMY